MDIITISLIVGFFNGLSNFVVFIGGGEEALTGKSKLRAAILSATLCVEINRCVGCTQQFFTKSFLGNDARIRHRHAIEQASRRWRGGRRDDSARTRRKILISTQVVVSAACETPLVYDLGNEDDEAVVVLGHGGAAAYCELAPKHVPKYARRLHAAAYAALVAQQHAPAAALRCVLCGAVRPRAGPPSTKPPPLEAEEAPADPDAALAKLRAAVESCEAALRESENDAFAATFGGSGGDPALASAAAVARRYALRAARAELEASKAAAAVTELRRDLAEALAREATLRAAHAGAS